MEFKGLKIARKDPDKCISCGKCLEYCRFNAIDEKFNIKDTGCEGCGVCEYVCPADAIELVDRISGQAYLSRTRFGPMAHAALKTAEEASGMLVALVRENAKRLARESGRELIIIDGPPGIGCPVIAAMAGVDLVLIVAEPTVSGIHDAERVMGVAKHFRVPAMLLVNKFDLNLEMTEKLEKFCRENGVEPVGRLPYDNVTTDAMIARKTVTEHSGDSPISAELMRIWAHLEGALNAKNNKETVE